MAEKTIAFVTYPELTLLDLAGPLQVIGTLAALNAGYHVVTVGQTTETHETDTPLAIAPNRTFAQVPKPDIVVVPGGMAGTLRAMTDDTMLNYLRTAATGAELMTSVCTGSLILGAAGLLHGREATTHWSMLGKLAVFGATPVSRRWVEDGPVLTAAGVAAGVDMALYLVARLAGEEAAWQAQFAIEYDPDPPFGTLDWDRAPRARWAPAVDAALREGLADHPELRGRLTSTEA
ncbi:DJ-1/PfpI family protein [Amycolatopsis cihanbeyliensis]|uniref:DJ-1/PfpI family protein n=1 Tax=Amycolatopsis cihanbeyliensis TaxID=1128664 RepID=A0A542DD49_AMYCI|nr:DJ-1/PfpI family protein [Amycolatopsis cihanbeyliensis]TQJ00999.1 DJ-1/PfpI family protein [Amycolatopsis cihanbeyliensis]